jgi:hypothetical protein
VSLLRSAVDREGSGAAALMPCLRGTASPPPRCHFLQNRHDLVAATADGAIIGGMVYRIDPELDMPFNDRTPEDKKEGCRDKAKQPLDCLNLPGGKVKRVRVRKVAIDVEMDSDDCCD